VVKEDSGSPRDKVKKGKRRVADGNGDKEG
jgi:hypothetical protein